MTIPESLLQAATLKPEEWIRAKASANVECDGIVWAESEAISLAARDKALREAEAYWGKRIRALEELLGQAQEPTCSMLCPSTWLTAKGRPPHSQLCSDISTALAPEKVT